MRAVPEFASSSTLGYLLASPRSHDLDSERNVELEQPPDDYWLQFSDFLNLFPQRAPQLMWFLGAGASVGAGLPSAGTLTWEFKRAIYCSLERIPPSRFPDLHDQHFQQVIQSYFDSKAEFPPLGDDSEYATYFEYYLSDERDRRRFLDSRLRNCKPSYGHMCFAALMALAQIRLVWTTNFDQLVERACATPVVDERLPRPLGVSGLEEPSKAEDLIRDEAYPLLIKLHGDFLFRKLKNTATELQDQDTTLRRHLEQECQRRGLIIIGYSGRDQSVMESLSSALNAPSPFPHGLFWFLRRSERPSPLVIKLITKARATGVQAALIETDTFDETMADLFLPHQDSMENIRDLVKESRPRRQPIPLERHPTHKWPVLRSNALEVTDYPASCTIFEATIGSTKEIRDLIDLHKSEVIAARRRHGVIAFGPKDRLEEIFGSYEPKQFDRHPIERRRLRYECQELSLLYHAIAQGIANKTKLIRSTHARGRFLFTPTRDIFSHEEQRHLNRINSKGVWTIRDGAILHEGFRISLDFKDQRFWAVLEPTIVVTSDGATPYAGADRSDITREPLVTRYNNKRNDMLNLWILFLKRTLGDPLHVTFPSDSQPEAEFRISTITAFSRRA